MTDAPDGTPPAATSSESGEPSPAETSQGAEAATDAATEAPVVPVALNSGVFWGRRRFLKRPGVITLEFLPPVPRGLDRRAFLSELQARIETASERLRAEAEVKVGAESTGGRTGP